MRIIALVNQKGGVGKTTATLNLGHGLARAGKRVLLVDIDPQANLTSWSGVGASSPSMVEVFTQNLPVDRVIVPGENGAPDVAPVTGDLAGIDIRIATLVDSRHKLKQGLRCVDGKYDFVLLDCPPSLGLLTVNALIACDEIFVPTQTKVMALTGIVPLLETIESIRRTYDHHNLAITGLIASMYDARTRLAKEVVEQIEQAPALKGRLFTTKIRENIKLAEAFSFEQSIFDYAPHSYGAEDFTNLAEEVIQQTIRGENDYEPIETADTNR